MHTDGWAGQKESARISGGGPATSLPCPSCGSVNSQQLPLTMVNTADMPTLAASLQEGLLSTKSTHMFSSVYTLTTHRQATRLLGATCALLPVTVCGISTVMSGPKVPTASLGFPQMACRVWRCCLLFAAGGHGHQFGSCRPARGSAHVSHVSLDSGGPLGQGWG